MLRNENGENKLKISLLLVYASSSTSSKGSCNLNHETSDVMTDLCYKWHNCCPHIDNITRHLMKIYFMHKAQNNITIKKHFKKH